MIKGSIHQRSIRILNIYIPNNKVSKYIKQKLIELQEKIENPKLKLETITPLFQ